MSDTQAVSSGIDLSKPSPARMYDYYLGGKDHHTADKIAAEKALSVVPYGRRIARANRRFLVRAVSHLAQKGVCQFIDIGSGLPTSPNVHETAWAVNPAARVVYVDNDPIVMAHNRALLPIKDGRVAAVQGDVRFPLDIVSDDALNRLIDFRQPVGVLFVAVLHFVTSEEDPYQAVAVFRERMAAGSYLAVSHITSEGTSPEVMSTIETAYKEASAPAVFRTRREIEAFFTGLDLLRPGLVQVSEWRGSKRRANPPALCFLGGVGRKP
jgi:hypothetical protein